MASRRFERPNLPPSMFALAQKMSDLHEELKALYTHVHPGPSRLSTLQLCPGIEATEEPGMRR